MLTWVTWISIRWLLNYTFSFSHEFLRVLEKTRVDWLFFKITRMNKVFREFLTEKFSRPRNLILKSAWTLGKVLNRSNSSTATAYLSYLFGCLGSESKKMTKTLFLGVTIFQVKANCWTTGTKPAITRLLMLCNVEFIPSSYTTQSTQLISSSCGEMYPNARILLDQ